MKIEPGTLKMKEIADKGEYKVMPVSTELLSDFITPMEVLRKLKNVSKHCYMLESAGQDMPLFKLCIRNCRAFHR